MVTFDILPMCLWPLYQAICEENPVVNRIAGTPTVPFVLSPSMSTLLPPSSSMSSLSPASSSMSTLSSSCYQCRYCRLHRRHQCRRCHHRGYRCHQCRQRGRHVVDVINVDIVIVKRLASYLPSIKSHVGFSTSATIRAIPYYCRAQPEPHSGYKVYTLRLLYHPALYMSQMVRIMRTRN